jgi:DNA-binding HxlR family transcriptional regulator
MANFKLNDKSYHCPVELTLNVVGGKWKVLLLWNMKGGVKRYGELKRLVPGITHKMLTQQLRELEDDGIINRKVYEIVPPRVEYSLTERGEQLKPVLEMMGQWGMQFLTVEDNNIPQAGSYCEAVN